VNLQEGFELKPMFEKIEVMATESLTFVIILGWELKMMLTLGCYM